MKKNALPCLLLLFAFSPIFASPALHAKKDRPIVYTVNYPLYYFAQRIAGDKIDVKFPAPENVDPAYWMPDTSTLMEYQQADLILANGAHYSRWINLVSLPGNRIINTSGQVKDRYIYMDGKVTHSHGPEGEHSHENIAFTTWLDLDIAREQAKSIFMAFARLLPEEEIEFKENLTDLLNDLYQLDRQLKSIAKKIGAEKLLASHPVYQYFSRRYQLNISSFHWEPDVVPSTREWRMLEVLQEKQAAKWMLWEDTPHPHTTEKLRSHGITPVVFKTIANYPENGDFISIMTDNIAAMGRIIITD